MTESATTAQPAAEKATPHKWTSQRRFIAEPEHVMRKWGLAKESLLCGICRKRFKVGDGVRWVCATAHGFYNFFVCDDCDSPDVIEVWGRISRLAQQDEYELAAKIVKLESQSAAFDALHVLWECARSFSNPVFRGGRFLGYA